MKLTLIQMHIDIDKEANVRRAEDLIHKAAEAGADMVVLPEMFCCPYSNEYFSDYAEPEGGHVWLSMAKAAADNRVYLVAGSMPEYDRGRVYNTSFVFSRQGVPIARHRKVHLFDIDVKGGQRFFESETFTAGDSVTLFNTEYGRLGLCICFDMRFPELARIMALRGAQAIIVPAAFNMTTGPAHWETMFRQRAVDNQLYTVGVSPARDENGVYVSYGNSIVCSPWGDVVRRAGAGEELIEAELDFSQNDSVREELPLLRARRADVYEVIEKRPIN